MRALALLVFVGVAAGCGTSRDQPDSASARPPAKVALASAAGDPKRGAALIEQFECNRCHAGTGSVGPALQKNCTGCHTEIVEGKFVADPGG